MKSNTLLWSSRFLLKSIMTFALIVALVSTSEESFEQNKSTSGLKNENNIPVCSKIKI